MKKQTIKQKIQSMTAKEIILVMVEGLENPTTKIDMGTYGTVMTTDKRKEVCYGCAATNAICKIGDYTTNDLLKVDGKPTLIKFSMALSHFESAINALRQGDIQLYNKYARLGKFAIIKVLPDFRLPILQDRYTKKQLAVYKKLADIQ